MAWVLRQAEITRHRTAARAAYSRFLAVRLDRRRLLRRAWAIARAAAARWGGSAVPFIAGSLRLAWQERRVFLAALA